MNKSIDKTQDALRVEQALKLALEALENYAPKVGGYAITAIREALASKSEALAQSLRDEEQPAQQQPSVHAISGRTADELWLETGRLRSELADLKAQHQGPLTGGDERRHIICLCPDCTKPAQQEPFALLVRKHSWNKGQYECAPPSAPEYGRQWADERVWVYKSPQPARRKPWAELSAEEMAALVKKYRGAPVALAFAIEANLREKNA